MHEEILHLPLNEIDVVSNTRSEFSEIGLKELAQSIKTNGVLQAIIVRREENGRYRLVCGERRFRASLIAKQADIPARVMEIADGDILTTQIVENLQRRNVSTMDEVRSIVRLRDENSMSLPEIGRAIGKAVSHIDGQIKISKAVPELHDALEKNYVTRVVGLLIAALDEPEKQIKAVAALKRTNPAHVVKKLDAERWISKIFGAQVKRKPYESRSGKAAPGRFASDWKYYLVRFSSEQFENWKSIVRNRTETEIFAEAVEAVMLEEKAAASGK